MGLTVNRLGLYRSATGDGSRISETSEVGILPGMGCKGNCEEHVLKCTAFLHTFTNLYPSLYNVALAV